MQGGWSLEAAIKKRLRYYANTTAVVTKVTDWQISNFERFSILSLSRKSTVVVVGLILSAQQAIVTGRGSV